MRRRRRDEIERENEMDGWAGRPAVRDPATDSRVRHPICLLLSLYIQPSLLLLLYNIPGARSLAPEFHLLPRDLSFSCFFLLSLSLPSIVTHLWRSFDSSLPTEDQQRE